MTALAECSTVASGAAQTHSGSAGQALSILTLVLADGELSAWLFAAGGRPRSLPVHGERRSKAQSAVQLEAALADLGARLKDEGVHVGQLHWLADHAGRLCLAGLQPACVPAVAPAWQVLAWEWLTGRFGCEPGYPDEDFLQGELLPWLLSADDAEDRRRLQAARQQEHLSESERLAAERAGLQRENEALRAQNAALQQVDAERLASFLPALFARAFTVLGAADLALLCGRVEPLAIPNPYPEPSEEALRVLQRDFRALPRQAQRQIAALVARLPQRQKLQPRPEMRELLFELERG
ncbi:hypothetical protein LH433_02600 [Laribacter hongkongensis]|uniref:hypothetical protein n=1 Tax=Laribacter hongkongensis TaxID=168471 RepID=UPI001EFEB0C6|nr:hypothetical protein [Laribacter hongkongensis]MCG9105647.1 hypothetical protein [Laribacter hongkongensis]